MNHPGAGPSRTWRNRPYRLSVVRKQSTPSICACRICHVNWNVISSRKAPASATSRPCVRRSRSYTSSVAPMPASSEGNRNPLRTDPVTAMADASSQKNSGGLSAYRSPPTRGISQSPLRSMSCATSAKRGSSAGHGSRNPRPAVSSSSASNTRPTTSSSVSRDDALPGRSNRSSTVGRPPVVAATQAPSSIRMRGEARRMSHIMPNRSTMPTQSLLCSPYLDVPRVRSRWLTGTETTS